MPRADKRPLNLRMDPEVIRKIKRYALERGRTASDVVAWLVTRHLAVPGRCEHGITEGEFCGPCNAACKAARIENQTESPDGDR